MKTPLRKLRVDDQTWAQWQAAAPDGNVSGWLRELANEELRRTAAPHVVEPELPAVTIGEPSRDPSREEFIRREAALLASVKEV